MNDDRQRSFIERRRILLVGAILIVIALLAGLGLSVGRDSSTSNTTADRKQVLDPAREIADFTLTSHTGELMNLSDLRGKPVLLFFGYTHCPDVCPTTMAEFRQVKGELGADADEVAFVFVSVDGTRDTPEVLAEFVGRFDAAFIGLTGDEAQIRTIGEDFSLFFQRAETEATPSAAGYLVDHTGYSYLLDDQGRLRTIYPYQSPIDVIVDDVTAMLG